MHLQVCGTCGPFEPGGLGGPVKPCGPVEPGGPFEPGGPGEPCKPRGPVERASNEVWLFHSDKRITMGI